MRPYLRDRLTLPMLAASNQVILIIFVAAAAFGSSWLNQPDGGPTRLYLANVPLQDEKLLVVNLALADVNDLYGAEIELDYNPAQLRVRDDNARLEGVQISPGPLLASEDRFVATNQADAEIGRIQFVFTLLRPAPPINEDGVLATLVFEIVGEGPYRLEISHAQLVSADSESLPVTLEGLHLGSEANVPLAGRRPTELVGDRWGAVVLLLGLMMLSFGVWAILWRFRAAPGPAAGLTASRRRPGDSRASIRSAELLTKQANYLFSHGNMESAYELFSQAIELDPANAEAWLGKGLVAQQEIEKRICFQRVLALDPDNEMAKQALKQIYKGNRQ